MLMFLALIALGAAPALAQQNQPPLASPDHSYTVFTTEPWKLWIEDLRTHERRLVIEGDRPDARWSSDSAAFFVNYAVASDLALSYIYTAATLDRIDVRDRIVHADPHAAGFAGDHDYFSAVSWIDSRHVVVSFKGHALTQKGAAPTSRVVCFDLRYRIGLDGSVERLSERAGPGSSRLCD
jgi:hypothetical protein